MQVVSRTDMSIDSRAAQMQGNYSTAGTGEARAQGQTKVNPDGVYIEDKRFSQEEVIDVIEKANKDFIAYDRRFEFSIHEATKEIMVKVIDVTTDEVIRELPPEKVLDMVAAMWEVAGIIVDKKI